MRAFVVLVLLALLSPPACAEVYANAFLKAEAGSFELSADKSTLSLSVAFSNTTALPYSMVFLSAALKDDRGNFYDRANQPTGIPVGRPYNCELGTVLAPGTPLVIVFTFRPPSRAVSNDPSLTISAEFQAQRQSCENFTVSLSNLKVGK